MADQRENGKTIGHRVKFEFSTGFATYSHDHKLGLLANIPLAWVFSWAGRYN